MGIEIAWNDARRVLSLHLAAGSRMLMPVRRNIEVKLGQTKRTLVFDGNPLTVSL